MSAKADDEIPVQLQYYEKAHLRGLPQSAVRSDKIKHLEKRTAKKLYQVIFNILAILFFAYLYVSEFVIFERWVVTALIIIFSLNTAFIFQQRKQIHELLEFYQEE